MNDLFVHIFA